MAKTKTVKSCYQSSYGGDWITATQKLAEIMCEKFAQKQGQTLSPRFWNESSGPWAKYFLQQMAQANRLLKMYRMDAIYAAIRTSGAKSIYSLGHPKLGPLIEIEQVKIENREKRADDAVVPEVVDVNIKPSVRKRTGKSLREKLGG